MTPWSKLAAVLIIVMVGMLAMGVIISNRPGVAEWILIAVAMPFVVRGIRRLLRWMESPAACARCGAVLRGPFCSKCGA